MVNVNYFRYQWQSKVYVITLYVTDIFRSEHVQRWRCCNNDNITVMRETKMSIPFLVKLTNPLLFHSFFKKSNVLLENQIEEVCQVMAIDVKKLICSVNFGANVNATVKK